MQTLKVNSKVILLTVYLILCIFTEIFFQTGHYPQPLIIIGFNLLLTYAIFQKIKSSPVIILFIIYLTTYSLGSLPYFLFSINIVPYFTFVNDSNFNYTNLIIILYNFGIYTFLTDFNKKIEFKFLNATTDLKVGNGLSFAIILVLIFYLILFLKGEVIINTDGENNFDQYMDNLSNQGGALEYFIIPLYISFLIIKDKMLKFILFGISIYFIYFCITRGYRIQMIQIVLLITNLFIIYNFNTKKVLILSFIGFFALQILGSLKHGHSFEDGVSIFAGDEIRTNQTEVFYTSTVLLSSVKYGLIQVGDRIFSATCAILAMIIPPSLLPSQWHPTLSVFEITKVPNGGGGHISSHYYYWFGYLGPLIGGYLTASAARLRLHSNSLGYGLFIIIFSTYPRWISYEPISQFFRISIYFILIYFLLRVIKFTLGR